MSLFLSALASPAAQGLEEQAKFGILAGSLFPATMGYMPLHNGCFAKLSVGPVGRSAGLNRIHARQMLYRPLPERRLANRVAAPHQSLEAIR